MPPQAPPPQPQPSHAGSILVAFIGTVATLVIVLGIAWYLGVISIAGVPNMFGGTNTSVTTGQESGGPEDLDRIIQGLEEIAETGNTSVPIMVEQGGQVSTSVAALREGVYTLSGETASGGTYAGLVTIVKRAQTANVYDMRWDLASGEQYGVGILQGGILSVGYHQAINGEVVEAGSVGFFVLDDSHLQGQWTSARGGGVGVEVLAWKSAQ